MVDRTGIEPVGLPSLESAGGLIAQQAATVRMETGPLDTLIMKLGAVAATVVDRRAASPTTALPHPAVAQDADMTDPLGALLHRLILLLNLTDR